MAGDLYKSVPGYREKTPAPIISKEAKKRAAAKVEQRKAAMDTYDKIMNWSPSAGQLLDKAHEIRQQDIDAGIKQSSQKEAEANMDLEAYKQSEQRKRDWDRFMDIAVSQLSPAKGDLDLQLAKLPEQTVNQTELGLESAANYYKQQRRGLEDQKILEADVNQVAKMSAEERKLLEDYAYGRNMWNDPDAVGRSISAQADLEKKYGKERVKELAESWVRYNNLVSSQKNQAQTAQEAGSGFLPGVAHNVASVAANTIGTFSAPLGYLQEAMGRTGRYQTLDPNNMGAMPGQYASAVRQGTAQAIEGENPNAARKLLSLGYQGAMSAADNGARILVSMGTGMNPMSLAAISGFGSTLSEASANGATPGEAVLMGIASAGLEAATEKLSLDELFKAGKAGYKGAANAVKTALKQAAVEATEEEISYLGGLVAEAAILREKSSYNRQIGELVAGGMSYQEAKAEADKSAWNEAAKTAIISAISGFTMSGSQSAGQKVAPQIEAAREKAAAAKEKAAVSKAETTTKGDIFQEAANEMLGVQTKQNAQQQVQGESAGIKQQMSARDTATANGLGQLVKDIGNGMSRQELLEKSREYSKQYNAIQDETPYGKPYTEEQRDRMHTADILYSAYRSAAKDPQGTANMYRAFLDDMEAGVDADNVRYDRNGRTVLAPIVAEETSGESEAQREEVIGSLSKFRRGRRVKAVNGYSVAVHTRNGSDTVTLSIGTPDGEYFPEEIENGRYWTNNQLKSLAADRIIEHMNKENYAPKGAPEGFEAMGAASRGFSPYTQMQIDYGNIPAGENPVRPDDAPISTDGTDRVSYTARTAIGAQVTPDEFVPLIENEVVRGGFSFIPITNDQTTQNTVQTIQAEGWQTARANWTAAVRQGRAGADITATGALLYNHAVNSGDYQEAMDILLDYQQAVRNSARGLQAARILKTLTPENRLYMIRRSVQRMVEDMHLDREITIDEDLARRYQETRDNEEADRILDEIARDVARQIPSTRAERFTALRYLNMLGNFRTQARNLVGNLTNKALYLAKDELAATIEGLASFASGGQFQRSKVNVTDRATRQAAAADYENVADWVSGGGRTNDRTDPSTDFANRVQDNRQIFRNRAMEGYRRATDWAMNNRYFGDAAFGRAAYSRALAGYLNARGIRTNDLSTVDPETLNAAREYAVRQAQEATFRDNNQVSTFVSRALRGRDTPAWARVIGEAIMPFRKTPANVLVRAEEFSPLGLINSAVNTVRAARGDISGAELVDSWAKSLTGTGLFAIGWALANMGHLRGGPDEDEEKAAFDKLNGFQDYSIQLPGGINFTIDAFSPTALPLLLGAQLDKVLDGSDLTFADLEGMLSTLSDPMIEMSMLSGLNDTIDAIRYADNSLGQFLVNAGFNYLTQALSNTLMGQVERSAEKSRMTTYTDKDSNIPAWLQRNLGKLSQKIPGWDYNQTEYIDQWGREQKNPEGIKNWLYQLLSPSYIDKAEVDEVAQELYRLNEAQTGVNVFPQSPETQVNYTDKNGNKHEKYSLSMEELDKLKRTEGQTQARLVAELIGGEDYKALTDSQKAEAVKLCYDYARELARGDVLPGYDGMSSWMEGIQGSEVKTIIGKVAGGELSDAFTALTTGWREGYADDSGAMEAIREAGDVYGAMSTDMRKAVRESASGRVAAYLDARAAGMGDSTFTGLYRKYWDIDQSGAKASEKANDWAYELQRSMERGEITKSQRDILKSGLRFTQNLTMEAEKFDQLTEGGLSADQADNLGWLLKGLKVQDGYKEVRDIQKAEAIGSAKGLSEADRVAALKIYGTDAQDEKLDAMLDLGYSAKDYVTAWQMYTNASGEGKKRRTIQAYMDRFGVDWNTAAAIYDIYG